MSPADPLLAVEGVTLRFGGVTALDGVSFTVDRDELVALIGPNGAGKTSILNCINGVFSPQAGDITFDGGRLSGRPVEVARCGVARTFQSPGLFSGLTVLDNLLLGRHNLMGTGFLAGALWLGRARREETEHRARVEEILELLELQPHRHAAPAVLPFGVQKRVELGRALATEPRLLLLDEPVAGMSLEETEDMARLLGDVRAQLGVAVLLIEHDMAFVVDLADRMVALDFGRVIAEGSPHAVCNAPAVIDAYLGVPA